MDDAEFGSRSQQTELLVHDKDRCLTMCLSFVFKGRQPSGNHEDALPGGVTGLRVQTAGDPREKEV